MLIALSDITADPKIQPRVDLNQSRLDYFGQVLLSGSTLDPVIVFNDGEFYWLSDGFHRFVACQMAKATQIEADVRIGTFRDACLCAIEKNAKHGLPLSLTERKKAAASLLRDPEWKTWSSRKIGQICGLNHKTVEKIKSKHFSPLSEQTNDGEFPQIQNFTEHPSLFTEQTNDGEFPQIQNFIEHPSSLTREIKDGEFPQIQNFTESASNLSAIRKAIRRGKIYEIDTSNIGRRSQHSKNFHLLTVSERNQRDAPSLAKIPPSTAFKLCQDPNVISIRAEELPSFSLLEVAVEEQPLKGDLSQHHLTVVSSGPVYAVPLIFKQMQTHPEFAEIVLQQAQQLASGTDCSMIS